MDLVIMYLKEKKIFSLHYKHQFINFIKSYHLSFVAVYKSFY